MCPHISLSYIYLFSLPIPCSPHSPCLMYVPSFSFLTFAPAPHMASSYILYIPSPSLLPLARSDRVQLTAMALQWQAQGQGLASRGQGLAMAGRKGRVGLEGGNNNNGEETSSEEEEDGEGVEEGGSMSEEDDEGSAVVVAAAQISSSSSSSSSSGVPSSAPSSSNHTNSDYTYCACTSLINFWRSPRPTG